MKRITFQKYVYPVSEPLGFSLAALAAVCFVLAVAHFFSSCLSDLF